MSEMPESLEGGYRNESAKVGTAFHVPTLADSFLYPPSRDSGFSGLGTQSSNFRRKKISQGLKSKFESQDQRLRRLVGGLGAEPPAGSQGAEPLE